MGPEQVPEEPGGMWRFGRRAAPIAVAVTLGLALLSLGSDQPIGEGLAAALSNGLLFFFLIAGIEVVSTKRYRISTVAVAAAGATMATVGAVRLIAVAAGAKGPFGSVTDTVLDVAARSAVVLAVVAFTGHSSRRRVDR